MIKTNNKKLIISILVFLFFCFFLLPIFVSADPDPGTEPCWVKGTAEGDGFDIDGVTLGAYLGNTLLKSQVLDEDGVFSLNSLGASTSDTISIKVLGATFHTFTFEGFCKTGEDPWVILNDGNNITISKVANGTSCSSNSICTSGYCSNGVCATQPGGGSPGGSSPGSSSPGSSTTTTPVVDEDEPIDVLGAQEIESVTNTIIITEEFNENTNLDDLVVTLEEEIISEVNLDTENLDLISSKLDFEGQIKIDEIKPLIYNTQENGNIIVTTNIKIYKIEDQSGNEVYRTKIELKLQANDDLENVIYIQEIPKDVAIDVVELVFNIPPSEILLADPIVKWEFDNMTYGEVKDLSYYVKKKIDFTPTFISLIGANNYIPEVDDSSQVTEPIVDEDNYIPLSDNTEVTTKSDSNYTWLYIILVIVIIAIILYFVLGNNKKKRRSKTKDLRKV
jgi:hypothetical protein